MKKHVIRWLLIIVCSAAGRSAGAAVLSSVPMQGTMVMPMLRYSASDGRLHVSLDPTVPQLTPLLVSHPGDEFDLADPWAADLDPRRRGLSFSRRYGFVMDTMTDPLPSDTAVWIRLLSSSSDLRFYRYRNTEPKAWEPIFGTAGSPPGLLWNGMMFHPGVTAPPGTDRLAASFEAVLVRTPSQEELPGTGTGPFELQWTNVPDGRPSVSIALKVVVECPATPDWVLETADSLESSVWRSVPHTPVVLEGRSVVILDAREEKQFYRMRRLP